MASKPVKDLSEREVADLSCTYAALLLFDEGLEITGANITKVITAAGVNVKGFWANLYAKALQGRDISALFRVTGGGESAPAAPAPADKKDDKKKDEKKDDKNKKPEKKEEPPA